MLGISYYSLNQWRVAAKHPTHLAAIIPWEGRNDYYRDSLYHGGILSQFQERWAKHAGGTVQYGRGERARKNPNTGESIAGAITLSDEELAANRVNIYEEIEKHPLCDEWHRARTADLIQVTVPLLSCANWGGQGIHPRGNFNGYRRGGLRAEVAGGARRFALVAVLGPLRPGVAEALFRLLSERHRQRLGARQPRVQLNVRHPGEKFVLRGENEWPLARTQWTKFYLDPGSSKSAEPRAPGRTRSCD